MACRGDEQGSWLPASALPGRGFLVVSWEGGKWRKTSQSFGPLSLWVSFPFALGEAMLLSASSVLLQVRGKKGFPAGGGWSVNTCGKMEQARFGARALPLGTGGLWGGDRITSCLYFTFSVPHHSCTPFSVLSPLLSQCKTNSVGNLDWL